jgi:hypothetical protein
VDGGGLKVDIAGWRFKLYEKELCIEPSAADDAYLQ